MNTSSTARRRWLKPALIITITSAITTALAYLWFDYRFPSWKEEVLLPDGRMIVVKQRRDFIEGYGTRKTWLTFSLPEMGGEQTWTQWLYPTMIGAANGKVYVVGRPRGSKQFRMYSYPRYVYVAYEWKDGKFERVPFLSVPDALRETENVRWCLPGGDDSKETFDENAQKAWCSWSRSPGSENHFPRPRKVDLSIRMSEAKFWARLSGNRPSSN